MAPPPPIIENISLESDGTISFRIATSPDRFYEVQFTAALGVAEWRALTRLRADAATLLVADDPAGAGQRFYRVVLIQ